MRSSPGIPKGFVLRNQLLAKYLKSTKFAKNATSTDERKKFDSVLGLFQKYCGQYDMDTLLMAAQGYQESRLDQGAKSPVGAVGVMQVMPSTGKELQVGDIHKVDPNIHAGVKYVRFMLDKYYAHEPMTPLDKGLFTFASYNAGPGRIAQLRKIAARARPRPEHLVQQRRADRLREDRAGDRDVRQQHLQVLPRLPARHGADEGAREGPPAAQGSSEATRPVRLQ